MIQSPGEAFLGWSGTDSWEHMSWNPGQKDGRFWSKQWEQKLLRVVVKGGTDRTTAHPDGKCELFSGRSNSDIQEMRGCND